ncbi:MAG: protocatechuate 3,4-dioxygenase subunit alpha [Casimicrobiaceae bacterium]
MSLLATSSQTVGPYVHLAFPHVASADLAPDGVPGVRVAVRGTIVDGDGKPMNDGFVEIWQADAEGRYVHPESSGAARASSGFKGFGRCATDTTGTFRFATIKPGRVAGPDGTLQAPHLSVLIFSRGLLKHLATRMYFPDDAANAEDPILRRVPEARRSTLIARREADGVAWNIVLQGPGETVFLDF